MRCITNRGIGLFCYYKQNSDVSIVVHILYFNSDIQRVTSGFIQNYKQWGSLWRTVDE